MVKHGIDRKTHWFWHFALAGGLALGLHGLFNNVSVVYHLCYDKQILPVFAVSLV